MPIERPCRSALYVPGSSEKALVKAARRGADVVILDLEDAVAPAAKGVARRNAAAYLSGSDRPARLVVRINGLDTPWGGEDLAALADSLPDALLLPKVSSPADLDAVRAALAACGGFPVSMPLWAMIETPRAVLDPLRIVDACTDRYPLAALVLGLNDLARETGTRQLAGRAPMLAWMMNVLAAGRSAGLVVLDGVFTDIADGAGLAAECRQARDCGFDGKTLIHPSQIGPCHAAFFPSDAELAEARQIVAAFALEENRNRGALLVGGRMVERLHADLAERLLATADAARQ